VSSLFDEKGEIAFFLGGQINCSTTIHSCTDVLRVSSVKDEDLEAWDEERFGGGVVRPESVRSYGSGAWEDGWW